MNKEKEYIVTLNQDEIDLIYIVSLFVGGSPTGDRGVFSGSYYNYDNLYMILGKNISNNLDHHCRGSIMFDN
jgi:hypothetical protein